MMDQAIRGFAKQFKYRPKIEGGKLKRYKRFVIAGMGGSHLAGDIIKTLKPELPIIIWTNYGLPELSESEWKKTLFIASSYSGNTEEPLDGFELARAKQIPIAAIAVGNKLLEQAQQHGIPYVTIPDTGIQPRSALGFSLMALLKVMKESELFNQAKELAKSLDPKMLEPAGQALAEKLRGRVPVVCASARNYSLAYNWKIKFNETGKVPAFYNVFPELNHNEMTGFDIKDSSRLLSERFHFIFLKDASDHPKILKRMNVTAKLYQDRGLRVEVLDLLGESAMLKIFNSLVLADWTAFHTGTSLGLETEQVPMVEEFKKLIV